jgi:tetratricopeptide (TPR) repeat protein
MNRNDFLNMIEDTIPVSRQMIGEVYELIDIFPYFQSAHLLLLKGLYSNADVKFDNQLRNSAIHVGDREVLYWLLKTKNTSDTDKIDIRLDSDLKKEIVSDTHQTVIESAKNSEYLIDEIEKDFDETKFIEKQDAHGQNPDHSIMIATEPDNIESEGVIFLPDEDISPSDDKVFFMDPGFAFPERSDLLELDLDKDNTSLLAEEEISLEDQDQLERNSKKLLESELIDKFIIANPRIEPQKDKSYVPDDDISKPYVEEAGGLVTETLAKIYINQGYYSRAMDIYEKLSLKFPEKSSYFASQIEKVKEYIKK